MTDPSRTIPDDRDRSEDPGEDRPDTPASSPQLPDDEAEKLGDFA